MKEYFKYNHGYLNVNDEAIFMTTSGNWSEIPLCKEKSAASRSSNANRKTKLYLFLFVLLLLAAIFFTKSKNVLFPLGFIALGFGAWRYMSNESGNRYKIPFTKIKAIHIDGPEMRIDFWDETSHLSTEIIPGLEEKGVRFFQENKIIPQN